jgi:DNA-binding IclR family transcriptional regulator
MFMPAQPWPSATANAICHSPTHLVRRLLALCDRELFMARPSPGTQRLIAVLNFFADHPGQAFSLTDLIRALRINRATCHSLLAELVNAGYLYRTNDKVYVLGPAVARLTRAANSHLSPLQIALPEMKALAFEYGVVCLAVFRDGNEAIAREQANSVPHLHWSLSRGTRWPLRPPFASVFLARSSPADIEAWLESLSPPPSEAERQATFDGVAFVRQHGFQFVARHDSGQNIEPISDWLYLPDPSERPAQPAASLDLKQSYQMASMSSPVLDKQGRVAFVISLSGFSGVRRGAQIAEIGAKLDIACRRITDFFLDSPEE